MHAVDNSSWDHIPYRQVSNFADAASNLMPIKLRIEIVRKKRVPDFKVHIRPGTIGLLTCHGHL